MARLAKKSLDDPLSVLSLERRLSLGSDDDVDLVVELQSICASKSELEISKPQIVDSKDELMVISSTAWNDSVFSANFIDPIIPALKQDGNPGICPLSRSQSVECSNRQSQTESLKNRVFLRVKSFLPVPRNNVSQSSQITKQSSSSSSSSNTRQIEAVSDSQEAIWNTHKKIQL